MQSAETVVEVLRARGRRGLPCERLYRQLFNTELFLMAWGRIYANDGAMTPGINGETADGMSLAKIGRIIDALRHAAGHPGVLLVPGRPRDLLEQEPDRCRAELPRPRDSEEMFGGRHRRPPPASTQPCGSSCPSAGPRHAAGDTARRPLVITCPYLRSGPGTATTPARNTPPAGQAAPRSRAPASPASTNSGVKTLVRTLDPVRQPHDPRKPLREPSCARKQ